MGNGTKANNNGNKLEQYVEDTLIRYDIKYQKQVKYEGIYGRIARMDFYLPEHDIALEVKNQTGSGSVSEKIPHVMHSLTKFPAETARLVCGDTLAINESRQSWWRSGGRGAIEWAEDFSENSTKNIGVLHFSDFENFIKGLKGLV